MPTLIDSTFSAPLRILGIPTVTMASASASAATPAPDTDLVMRDFTMVRNNSVLDDEIQEPDALPPQTVHGPQWLRDAYMAICHKFNPLDRVIAEMQLTNEDPARTAPGLCKVYNMLLRQQHLLFDQQADALATAVTPNEALPHLGRQPGRNAKDDRCNLPALL